ncbi:hypothetical protein D4764_0262140 [Takifugu flavidus]|uniref:Uncharacterized protein n=1 Tax=Takifugu flavidus TaxID=433684 RepID=A0A5C6MGT8_9TELE|nr:hypothetical protein D4764_0262140 [Takifugu flavidus]
MRFQKTAIKTPFSSLLQPCR